MIRTVRVWLVAVVVSVTGYSHAVDLFAQLPLQGAGWVVAYGGGASSSGALGVIADVTSPPVGLRIPGEEWNDIIDVATSGGHTLIARNHGEVWVMGANNRGQLGLGFAGDPIATPVQIPGLVDIVTVAANGDSSYALDTAGVLWAWGDDSLGQLGIGNPGGATMQMEPVMSPLSDVIDVDAGDGFAVACKLDGTVWAWGTNGTMQLGAAGSGRNVPEPVELPADFFAVEIAAGSSTALARSFTKEVIGWGNNAARQLADAGDAIPAGAMLTTGAVSIAAGDNHIAIARDDGSVLVRGANQFGQLGIGNFDPQAGPLVVPGLIDVVAVAAGASHSVAVTASGVGYAWGANDQRQLMMPTAAQAVATPSRILDVPSTVRYVRARRNTTIVMNDPGTLAVTHNIEMYPFELECGQPFNASLSITGFNATGGQLNNIHAGLTGLVVTLNVTSAFERSGPVSATAGSVATNGTQITWTLPSLGASTATLNMRIYPAGPEGEFAVFDPFTYVSAEHPAPFAARSPLAFHRECAAAGDQTPPVIVSVTPSISSLSPPNRQMVPVTLFVEATDNVSPPVCAITGVSSNEPMEDAGDWAIVAPLRLNLRAERSPHGNGRVYTIAVACVDEAGNAAIGSTIVTVPKGKHH